MPKDADHRILVKLRPSAALRAAESDVRIRPLYDVPQDAVLGVSAQPQWYIADVPAGAPNAWDSAHARLADQLGVAESDVIFAEPDVLHRIYQDEDPDRALRLAAVGGDCVPIPQNGSNGIPIGPGQAWHLEAQFSQLADARRAVSFTDRRTRVGHLDTGYMPGHVTLPRHLRHDLERNFVDKGDEANAADPDNRAFPGLDNSGHGTGTLSILAGGTYPPYGIDLGGAPDADIVPLRIADSVVLLRTSAFARAIQYAVDCGCDVVSMSMGGLPSNAWREAVDRAYLAGTCMVTAAGNNYSGAPTRHVVYPARYSRVIAACGAMANHHPYARLPGLKTMEGNFGPDKVMAHALGAYTPNIPWALFGCSALVRENGAGTSAATPQIAAAVTLWFEKYKALLPRDWRRIEAVRKALFSTAKKVHAKELGNGILQALDALGVRPDLTLKQTKGDSDSFAFLRVITGLGIAEVPPRERMFNLEIEQRWLLNPELQEIVPDPDLATLDEPTLRRLMQAIVEDDGASTALRRHVAQRYVAVVGSSPPRTPASEVVLPADIPVCDAQPAISDPPYRRLMVYAVDPSFSTQLATAGMNEVALDIRWEALEPGPVGEYLAIEDVPIAGKPNAVDLDDPRLLAQDGWAPSEGNPQFHQQMVYAVAMKTISHFERALGRPVLWRHAHVPTNPNDDSVYTPRLLVQPHALRQANAFYSPHEIALKFGYFEASADAHEGTVPGSRIYACLSHDIIAHETTHAILDGMHRRFNEPTNPDVLAFHEGFADIVSLLQHFTIREVLENEVRRTRGDIEAESILGSLAVQFGKAMGGRGALREAIGRMENGKWQRSAPDPAQLKTRLTPHARGAILVAAVFDAFLAIYQARIADLIRINTGGTGILPNGAIHPDLVGRLTDEAAKSADHVLNMCIRALDYLPPVDITFFEYLRALITADFDLVRDDRHNYRVAFVEAFRRRGIYPATMDDPANDTVRTLSVDTLRWQKLDSSAFAANRVLVKQYKIILKQLDRYANDCIYEDDRKSLFKKTRAARALLQRNLATAFEAAPALSAALGLDPDRTFEVHELRRAMRISPDGKYTPQVVVSLTQSLTEPATADTPEHFFRGGSTLVVDLKAAEVKYCIMKRVQSAGRKERTAAFLREAAADPLRALLLAPQREEPFAVLHALADDRV